MSAREHETFAEIVTESVMGGEAKRRALLAHPQLGRLARSVFDYLDGGFNPDLLSG